MNSFDCMYAVQHTAILIGAPPLYRCFSQGTNTSPSSFDCPYACIAELCGRASSLFIAVQAPFCTDLESSRHPSAC